MFDIVGSMKTIRYRLSKDFQLAIVSLMGFIVLLGISPFMILRALNGQWQGFAVDLLILCGISGIIAYSWLSGQTRIPSLLLACFIGFMGVVAIHILGAAGRYWFYPVIVACFFLVHRRHALGIAFVSLLVVMTNGTLESSASDNASFAVTVTVCALLSYVFAYRTEVQRNQLETLATKDALTGTFNRHLLLEELERAHRIYAREQSNFGILILDLDHFKSINDLHGHQAGDQVLVKLARLLEQQIRKNDRLFRYGGEEFVILAHGVTEGTLDAMACNLRVAVESHLLCPNGKPITVSIGGAMLRDNETVDTWFARADTALYTCKNGGRNQIFIDPEGIPLLAVS
jgi:diguanylate cyclase (GGDEF)-like protein